jgi:hypothetical protein
MVLNVSLDASFDNMWDLKTIQRKAGGVNSKVKKVVPVLT